MANRQTAVEIQLQLARTLGVKPFFLRNRFQNPGQSFKIGFQGFSIKRQVNTVNQVHLGNRCITLAVSLPWHSVCVVPCLVPLLPCILPLVPRVVPRIPCVPPPVPCAVPLLPCVVVVGSWSGAGGDLRFGRYCQAQVETSSDPVADPLTQSTAPVG